MVPYFVLIALCVLLDQVVKYLVRANIPLGGSVSFLPGIMDLTYYQNTGMAFSLFSEHTWVLTILSAAVAVALTTLLLSRFITHPFGRISLSLVIAGALGNLIDRVAFHYVRDFLDFIIFGYDFPIFNVADMALCVGVGLLILITLIRPEGEKQ